MAGQRRHLGPAAAAGGAGSPRDPASAPRGKEQPPTQEEGSRTVGSAVRRRPHRPEAAADVRAYFDRNGTARMAMAFLYQEYILGLPAPQPVPMIDVAIAFDLSGEGTVSDYKKLLQDLIWNERGHQRDLAEFLLANGLLTRLISTSPGRPRWPTSAAARPR